MKWITSYWILSGVCLTLVLITSSMCEVAANPPIDAESQDRGRSRPTLKEFFRDRGVRDYRDYLNQQVLLGRTIKEIDREIDWEVRGIRHDPLFDEPPGGWTEEVVIERLKTPNLDVYGVHKYSVEALLHTLKDIGREKALEFLSDPKNIYPLGGPDGFTESVRTQIKYRLASKSKKRAMVLRLLEDEKHPAFIHAVDWSGDLGLTEALPIVDAILTRRNPKPGTIEERALVARMKIELQQQYPRPEAYIRAAQCDGSQGDPHTADLCHVRRWGIRMMGDDPSPEGTAYLRECVEAYHERPRDRVWELYNLPPDSKELDEYYCAMEKVLARLEGRKSNCQSVYDVQH